MSLTLHPVRTAEDRRRYAALPFRLYRDTPAWVPPQWGSEQALLDPARNPSLAHSEAQAWLALRHGETVGRLTVLLNPRETVYLGEAHARFGWTDFIDDPAVSQCLLSAATDWAKARGASLLKGPHGFTSLDAAGWVVEGFERLSTFATRYNAAYYASHLSRLGFRPRVDWVEHHLSVPDRLPPRIERLRTLLPERYGLRYRSFTSRAALRRAAPAIFQVLLDSYAPLTGWVPLTPAEQQHYLAAYFDWLRPDCVGLVEDTQGEVVGFGVTLPSLAQAMRRAGGRLWPWGWYHLLRAQHRNHSADLILIGSTPAWQGKGIPALIFAHLYQTFRRLGIRRVNIHPMMVHNSPVLSLFKDYDLTLFRRRRVWGVEIRNS